jgi:tetratricopeptide (TPR) repeat protein
MSRGLLILCCLVLAAPTAIGESKVDRALSDLESPYLEARRRAVAELARSGEEGEAAMRRAYPRADFRTRILILDGFAKSRPGAGLPLIFSDLGTLDRGVVLAQRRLLSAYYGEVRELAESALPAGLVKDVADWRIREGLRAVPGPGESPAKALAKIAASEYLALRLGGRQLTGRVEELAKVRRRLSEIADGNDPAKARRAKELTFRLLRHDTERALLAVFQENARDGSFDGMYAIVGELVSKSDDPDALDVLLAILKDEPAAESGVPPDVKRGYRFLEPRPPDCDRLMGRGIAAACLGDIGDAETGAKLAEYFGKMPWNSNPSWQKDPELRLIDDLTTPKFSVALACAALGEKAPLRARIRYLEKELEGFFSGSQWNRRQLALAYSRIGEDEKAVRQYEYCIAETPRDAILHYNLACAFARQGRIESALRSLSAAKRSGYGADPSQISWAFRDGDLEQVRKHPGFERLFGKE